MVAFNKVIALYRTIYLNLPRATRLAGILLILAVGMIHLYKAPEHFEADAYIGMLFVANFVGTLVAAVGIYGGARVWGWWLGALICVGAVLAYLASRTVGLPGLEEYVGEWADPLGSLSVILEIFYLAGYLSVGTGMAVAAPERRDWHD
ncbi:MAG: hypothetical protein M3305_04245 [Actinomycetota bacterium]|nr:hypothetical protein [Actinomycetota bacterium]